MTICLMAFFLLPTAAQPKKACDLTDVTTINNLLGTNLQYDANSPINKTGKFECRYTDPAVPGKYISIGLLESKIEYGYDALKSELDNNKKSIGEGKKAGGIFVEFKSFSQGNANAYMMFAPKSDFSPEVFTFKFRKGNYIVSFNGQDIPAKIIGQKANDIYQLLQAKL
jgi:hypothetical protein